MSALDTFFLFLIAMNLAFIASALQDIRARLSAPKKGNV